MRARMKYLAVLLTALILTAASAGAAFAYEKDDKAIKSVNLHVDGYIEIETKFGEEELNVSTSGNKYDFDHYEIQNFGFRWMLDDTPDIKIYLSANEGYYFRIIKASQIKLTGGATYVSAAREDNGYTLVVEVKLPPLNTQVSPIEEAKLSDTGICTWSPSEGAGSYEVKFMRNGTTLGGVQTVSADSELKLDCSRFMVKGASYHFKVRPVNAVDTTRTGAWVDSNDIIIGAEQADAQRELNKAEQSAGTWEQENGRWRFRLPDQNLMTSGWRQINEEWYSFDEEGWMRTGWYQEGETWYYLDPEDGHMWRNTTTPDGYELSISGAMATGDAIDRP